MRPFGTLLGAAALALVVATAPVAWAGSAVVIQTIDGRTLAGELIGVSESGLVLHTGDGEVVVPLADIDRARSVDLSGDGGDDVLGPALEAAPVASWPAETPSPATAPEAPLADYLLDAAGERTLEYDRRRIRLVASDGTPIGSRAAGFRSIHLGRDRKRAFAAVTGEAGAYLAVGDFVTAYGDEQLLRRYSVRLDKARVKMGIGLGFVFTASTAALVGIVGGIPEASVTGDAPFPWAYFVGAAIPVSIVGAIITGKGHVELARLQGRDLRYVVDRREAWDLGQEHNGALRRELGIPDDERMDGPGSD